MLAQSFVTVLAAPPHMRGPMLPILPDSCFPGYRTGAFGAPEYSNYMTSINEFMTEIRFIYTDCKNIGSANRFTYVSVLSDSSC